jgi:uncharacterized protein YpiB (UPF0302 family)
MRHLNKDQKNELMTISSVGQVSMYEKEAEMVLLKSIVSFQKEKLNEKIDNSLKNRDKDLFMKLSKQYITLTTQYNDLN